MKLKLLEKLIYNNMVWAFIQRRAVIPYWSESVELPEDPVILEIGCGRGAGSTSIASRFNPSRLDAFDYDEDMIEKAREYVSEGLKGKINLKVDDVKDIDAGDGQYDAVFDSLTLCHVTDWEKALSEVSRVLKPGGYFAFMELYASTVSFYPLKYILTIPEGNRFERSEWVRSLAENRLRLMEKKHNLWGRGIVGVAKKTQ